MNKVKKEMISIKSMNTLGFNIFVKDIYEPANLEQVVNLFRLESIRESNLMILGSGSNVLFKGDFDGIIIKPSIKDIKIAKEDANNVYLRVGAGVEWDKLVEYAVDRGWGGIENLSHIPGSVGACPVQNIGAYGAEVADVIELIEYLDITTGELVKINGLDADFGYRDSIFKRELKSKAVIVYVTFRLDKYPSINCEYADVKEFLLTKSKEYNSLNAISIADVRRAIISIRKEKLPDPLEIGNVGSFFRNPVITMAEFEVLLEKEPFAKYYKIDDSTVKIPAAWLIDRCGFKGLREGNVGVHPKQALVLLAYENATGQELLALAKKISDAVMAKFGIIIEPEVNII